jgi:peptidoglycan/LPS O-acetylase OafA/YrhL
LNEVDEVMPSIGWSLIFLTNWALLAERPVVMGHLWTVALEGQFYLAWSVAMVVALRFRRATELLAIVAVAGWRLVALERGTSMFHLYVGTLTRLDAPLVGALAGAATAAGCLDRLRGRVAAAVSVGGLLAVVVGASFLNPWDPVLYRGLFTVMALGAACAVVGAVRAGDGALVRLLGARPLVLAGIVSYSLYLWHLPVFEWLARKTPGWAPPVRSVVGVAAAGGAAALSYRFIERPFLRRRHR